MSLVALNLVDLWGGGVPYIYIYTIYIYTVSGQLKQTPLCVVLSSWRNTRPADAEGAALVLSCLQRVILGQHSRLPSQQNQQWGIVLKAPTTTRPAVGPKACGRGQPQPRSLKFKRKASKDCAPQLYSRDSTSLQHAVQTKQNHRISARC